MSVAIKSFASRAEQATALAGRVAEDLGAALRRGDRAALAVPGGATPEAFLRALAERRLDWRRVHVTLTDERWRPPSDERSNERLLRRALLTRRAAAADFVPLYAEVPEPEPALAGIARRLAAVLPLTVCVLGMGTDGHTASLIPGAARLAEALDPRSAAPLLPMRAPELPEPRVTLTAAVLNAAARCYLLIAGEEKRAALDRALRDGEAAEMPVRAILRGPRPVTVFHAP